MTVFPNCKINLGLHVINKLPDGYHSIETVFYPLNWCDILEVLENKGSHELFTFSQSGINIDGALESNLIYKAWKLMSANNKIGPIKVHLHKNIPMGAGLGGGSADAAAFINLVNDQFKLGYGEAEKMTLASALGSDCAFFIKNRPVLARGKGNEFSAIKIDLSAYYILVVYPAIHSNTKEAYEALNPITPAQALTEILEKSHPGEWKNTLVNDFEKTIFKKHPETGVLKQLLYKQGALYASLSGSGSSVFGIFENEPTTDFPSAYKWFLQKPETKIL